MLMDVEGIDERLANHIARLFTRDPENLWKNK